MTRRLQGTLVHFLEWGHSRLLLWAACVSRALYCLCRDCTEGTGVTVTDTALPSLSLHVAGNQTRNRMTGKKRLIFSD